MPSEKLFVPTVDEVALMAPQLNAWATMAARSFGLYTGINNAIRGAADKGAGVVHHADELLMQLALLCVVRTFALIDRESDVSLQSAYRFLKTDGSLDGISALYAAAPEPSSIEGARITCSRSMSRFFDAYGKIDWQALGRLQSFRNTAIAHVAWADVKKFVTFGELERFVRIAAILAGELTLMTSGRNDWPSEQIESGQDAEHLWKAIFAAHASGALD